MVEAEELRMIRESSSVPAAEFGVGGARER